MEEGDDAPSLVLLGFVVAVAAVVSAFIASTLSRVYSLTGVEGGDAFANTSIVVYLAASWIVFIIAFYIFKRVYESIYER